MASEAEVDLIINAAGALPELERDLDRIINTAQRNADDVDVNAALATSASLARISTDLNRVLTAAQNGADDIDVDAVLNQLTSVNNMRRDLDGVVRQVTAGAPDIDLTAVLNSRQALRQVRPELNRVVRAAQAAAPDIRLRVDVDDADRGVRGFTTVLTRVTSVATAVAKGLALTGAAIAAVSLAAAAAVPLLAGLVAALQNIAPASAIGVSAILTVVLAANTLKLAMVGVGDAVKAAFDPSLTPDEFAETLKGLAPEAKKFVVELRSMRKELSDVQKGVQNRVFKDFDQTLERLSKAVLPVVRGALNRTADSLNAMARGAADAATDLGDSGVLGRALSSSTKSLEALEKVPGNVVTAFGALAAAAGPQLERISAKVAEVSQNMADSLAGALKSGALEESINAAVEAIKQLGRIAGNVFGGLGNILKTVNTEGDGLFGTLEKVTQAFQDATATEGFQRALTELVKVAGQLANSILPVLGEAFKIVGGIVEIIGPPIRRLVELLGERLEGSLRKASPAFDALARVAAALEEPLAIIIGLFFDLLDQVLPILTPLFAGFQQTIEDLTPFLAELANIVRESLAPILAELPGILEQIVPKFVELADRILPILTDVMRDLGPLIGDLAVAFADLLVQVTPIIVEILDLTARLLNDLGPAINFIVGALTGIFAGALRLVTAFINDVVTPTIRTLSALLKGDFSAAFNIVLGVVAQMTARASALWGQFSSFVSSKARELASAAVSEFARLASGALNSVSRLVGDVGRFFGQLPGVIRSALGNAGAILFSAGAQIVQGLISGLLSKLAVLRQVAASIAETVAGAVTDFLKISSPSKLFISIGEDTLAGFILGLKKTMPALADQVGQIALAVPSLAAPGSQTQAGFRLTVPEQQAPVIQVFVGNEQLDARTAIIARDQINVRQRVLAQGVRR